VSVSPSVLIPAVITMAAFFLLVVVMGARAQRKRGRSGREGMVGEIGDVRKASDVSGNLKVFVHGEYWNARADDTLEVGDPIEVIDLEGLRMHVRRRAV
jgi:membrane-bound serine protease (ClpP class)